jgi:hypothetical protein
MVNGKWAEMSCSPSAFDVPPDIKRESSAKGRPMRGDGILRGHFDTNTYN